MSFAQREIVCAHISNTRNGIAGYWTRIAYLKYRVGWNSPQIAQEMGTTPWCVRQVLWRMNQIARELFEPEWLVPPRVAKKPRRRRGRLSIQSIIRLRAKGMRYEEIAKRLRYSRHHVTKTAFRYRKAGGKIPFHNPKKSFWLTEEGGWKIHEMRQAGQSFYKIAAAMNVHNGNANPIREAYAAWLRRHTAAQTMKEENHDKHGQETNYPSREAATATCRRGNEAGAETEINHDEQNDCETHFEVEECCA